MTSSICNKSPRTEPGVFTWRQLVFQWLALLVVFSLGLSSFGPMLDHHFAERHPGHGHFYFGAAASDHSHTINLSHTHTDLTMLGRAVVAPEDLNVDGIVFVSPNAGGGTGAADPTLPLTAPSFVGIGDGAAPLNATVGDRAVISGTVIAPPTRPPRA